MTIDSVENIMSNFSNLKILVIGDIFLDKYYTYDPNVGKPSLETSLKPIVVTEYSASPGAAGNVAKNIALLGAKVYMIGIIGDDEEGMTLKKCLDDYEIDHTGVIISKNRSTQFYAKFFNKITLQEDLPRVDRHDMKELTGEEKDKLINNVNIITPKVDAIIIVDQCEMGRLRILEREITNELRRLKRKYTKKLFIADSRLRLHEFGDFCYIKANIKELKILFENTVKNDVERFVNYTDLFAQKSAKKVIKKNKNPIIVTLGERGSIAFDENKMFRVFPKKSKVVDVCGAGDSFTAGFVLSFLSTRSILNAAKFGNLCAGICVEQTGTGKITQDIVLSNFEDITGFEISDDIYMHNIDMVERIRKNSVKPKVALVDFDGTISLLRRGWESIMKEVMIKAITGGREMEDNMKYEIEKLVEDIIDKTTGVQTIVQMKVLAALVKKYKFVSEDEIKDEKYYKRIYTEKLKKMVNERMEKIKNGECKKEEYILSGALNFLSSLKKRKVKIFLASGTDKTDVMYEAKFLSVKKFFDDVQGALDDQKAYSKQKLMESIVKKFNLKFGELLVVGDGPVEIMNGWKYGALTIGIASNEYDGKGWDMKKLSRLVRANATIVIPDFNCWKSVEKLIF